MPSYDSVGFSPPAPVALVDVRSWQDGRTVASVPMLIDSGADVSLLPRSHVAELLTSQDEATEYELEGFDGNRSKVPVAQLELRLLGKSFRGPFLIVDDRCGILGRNILNSLSINFDGPSLTWTKNRPWPL